MQSRDGMAYLGTNIHFDCILLLILNGWTLFIVDTDGFVIPSLEIGDSDQNKPHVPDKESSNSSAKVS